MKADDVVLIQWDGQPCNNCFGVVAQEMQSEKGVPVFVPAPHGEVTRFVVPLDKLLYVGRNPLAVPAGDDVPGLPPDLPQDQWLRPQQ